jgi:sortase (surface protein transpeptidase)
MDLAAKIHSPCHYLVQPSVKKPIASEIERGACTSLRTTLYPSRRSLVDLRNGLLLAALLVVSVLGACVNTQTGGGLSGPDPSALMSVSLQPVAQPMINPPLLGQIVDPSLDLRAGPVAVPLELHIPSLRLVAPVLGVGITAEDVMDAPKGMATDPVWQSAFWYRGGGIPGDVGTATLAGHVDDLLGRPAVFAHLGELEPGDLIIIHDTRSGLDMRFTVVQSEIYTARQAADPAILAQVYGSGPASGRGPLPAPDGLSHLTFITCSGSYVDGAYDHRLVVYATRSE